MCVQRQTYSNHSCPVDRLKDIDDATNKFSQLVQRWHDELTLEGHPLAERYVSAGGTVVCELEISSFDEERCCVGRDNEPIGDYKFFASLVYRSHPSNNRVFAPSNQEPMFVFDVEVVEMEKKLALPSLVGLYGIQEKSSDLFSGSMFQAIDGTFKSILGSMKWESSLPGLRNNQRAPSMIEGRSEVVDRIPQNADEIVGKWISRSDAEHIATSIKVFFDGDRVRVSVSENLRLTIKVVDVLFGPFNL